MNRRIAKRCIDFYARNLRSHPEATWLVTSTLAVAAFSSIFFVGSMLTDKILIDDVEVEAAAQPRMHSGNALAQQALSLLEASIDARLGRLPLSVSVGNFVERGSDRYESELACSTNLDVGVDSRRIYVEGLRRAELVSSGLAKIARQDGVWAVGLGLRPFFGLSPARELRPSISMIDEHRFVARIEVPAAPTLAAYQEFTNPSDAARVLANLLVDFLVPQLSATELLLSGRTALSNFRRSREIAEQFLRDRQAVLFVENTAAASDLEASRTAADRPNKYTAHLARNREFLMEMDFSRYGELGLITKWGIVERILIAEDIAGGGHGSFDDPRFRRTARQALDRHRAGLNGTDAGRTLVALLEMRLGDDRSFRRALNAVAGDASVPQAIRSQRRQRLVAQFAAALAMDGRYAEADRILASPDYLAIGLTEMDEQTLGIRNAVSALTRAVRGDLQEYSRIVFGMNIISPCLEMFITSRLSSDLRSSNISASRMQTLQNLNLHSVQKLEMAGIRNFSFFNTAGIIADRAGNLSEAGRFFTRSQAFEGDHSWALLNWGAAALRANQLELARNRYELSLTYDTIPNAAQGLLSTFLQLNDRASYVAAAEKYASIILVYPLSTRVEMERGAMRLTCERPGWSYTPFFLRPHEYSALNGNARLYCP